MLSFVTLSPNRQPERRHIIEAFEQPVAQPARLCFRRAGTQAGVLR